VRAASVRGRSHSYRGETRQDAFGIRLSSDERWVIIAVADGLGSARHAELASAAAVHAVLERVNEDLARDPRPEQWEWKAVTSHVAKAIEMVTDNLGSVVPGTNAGGRTPGAKPGTTLTVGVVPATGEGQGICAAVGDSPALLLSGGKWYEVVGAGVKDSHNANLTSALPGDFGDVEVRAFAWHAGDLLIITSDGFAASVAGGQTDFARRLTTLWRSPPGLPEFHRQVDFRASTFDDDRTVVALWAGAYDTAVR
jgi:serine/threonine protein phosphatase PrpC